MNGRKTAVLVGILGVQACATMTNEPARIEVFEARATCSQALRASRDAMRKLGYTVEAITPAREGAPARVVGVRNTGWSAADPTAGQRYEATAEVRCDDSGATVAATADGPSLDRMRFPGDFSRAWRDAIASAGAGRRSGGGIRGSAEPTRIERGLSISVVPGTVEEAPGFGGFDPVASGILPVHVEIANRTERRYRFDPASLRMTTIEGERREALGESELRRRAAAVPGLFEKLSEAALAASEIAPGSSLRGYVYFLPAAYRRATVSATDIETEEDEGFSIRF